MDAIPFINEMLREASLKEFLTKNEPEYLACLDWLVKALIKVEMFMKRGHFKKQPPDKKQALIEGLRLTVRKVGDFMSHVVQQGSDKHSSDDQNNNLVNDWKETLDFIVGILMHCNDLRKAANAAEEVESTNIEELINLPVDVSSIENLPLKREQYQALLKKACPVLCNLKEPSEIQNFLLELSKQLDNLPDLICNSCDGVNLALILVGSLLSLKERAYDIWSKVQSDLELIHREGLRNTQDRLLAIVQYCYEDLPYFLKPCFLYLACYPLEYEIPARSLTEIWIAEGFIAEDGGKTKEDVAKKYLEQLVQRSLVHVSTRSLLGTIKYCRVHPLIHRFAIEQSEKDGFLLPNPNKEIIESLFRLAIHKDDSNESTELKNNHIHSFLAFNFSRNIIRSAVFLRVLELRNSAISDATLSKMTYIRYLGLRGSSITTLPEDIGKMKHLQTLDVRDTNLETLPKSLWSIPTLRHVQVSPRPQIEGPPPKADIKDLQILKTVVIPQSWLNECPQFLISLRKLALMSNLDNPDWKSVSSLLSQLAHLVSLTIIGKSVPSEFMDTRAFPNLESVKPVPSEFMDTRAFPNLESVKSFRLEAEWSCRQLFIDNIKFPSNLTKLTLSNSRLKYDPMPKLAKLPILKFLCLKEAYTGKQMICPENGFPLLQLLELSNLESLKEVVVDENGFPLLQHLELSNLVSLEEVEVKSTAMPHCSIVKIKECREDFSRTSLENHPNIELVFIRSSEN